MEFPDELKKAYNVYSRFQGDLARWFSEYSTIMNAREDVVLLWMTRKVFGDDLRTDRITYTGQCTRRTHDADIEQIIQNRLTGYVFVSSKGGTHECYRITRATTIVPRGAREAPVYEFEITRIYENDVISERYNEYYVNTFRHQMCKKLRSMSRYGFVPDKFDGYSMSCGIVRAKFLLLVDWV